MRKQRVISAIVLIALAAAATALGSYVLGALILVFICMGIYEIYKAFENKGFRPVYAIGFCFAVLFLLQTVFQTPEMMNLYMCRTELMFRGSRARSTGKRLQKVVWNLHL